MTLLQAKKARSFRVIELHIKCSTHTYIWVIKFDLRPYSH